ncbi:metal ABC transporter ATP-binding protein [Atopobium fossor]|uniref:metal ABC transporter ATP-binding protein n=1 Tax=Atopobium fossor TaxID=39487 RepID=UPI0006851F7E|nr:metal ABC transporter ATP-binding protein [Atopobium fossor]
MIDDPRGEYSTVAASPLSLAHVSVRLGKKQILSDVSLELGWGDTLVLLGANGAGKSTLIKTAIGELVPHEGTAKLFGFNATRFEDWNRIGYVQQLPPTSAVRFPATSLELVQSSCIGIRGGKVRRARALETLKQVGMQDYAQQIIGSLSGGQLQRVRLAASLASKPDLLILDEPTTGIDQKSTCDFFELINTIKQQRVLSVLLVTHDQDAIDLAGGTILSLEDGCLCTPNALLSRQEA